MFQACQSSAGPRGVSSVLLSSVGVCPGSSAYPSFGCVWWDIFSLQFLRLGGRCGLGITVSRRYNVTGTTCPLIPLGFWADAGPDPITPTV